MYTLNRLVHLLLAHLAVTNKKIFKISANENTLWTAAMLNFRSMPKNTNLVENHPMNISGKYGSNLFCGFREEDLNVKS
jgi:hypothetical protein